MLEDHGVSEDAPDSPLFSIHITVKTSDADSLENFLNEMREKYTIHLDSDLILENGAKSTRSLSSQLGVIKRIEKSQHNRVVKEHHLQQLERINEEKQCTTSTNEEPENQSDSDIEDSTEIEWEWDFPDWVDIKTKIIINDILKNLRCPDKHGYRWHKESLDFAYMLYCSSPETLSIGRKLVPAPSKSRLEKLYNPRVTEMLEELQSNSGFYELFQKIQPTIPENIDPVYSIAIDAIAASLWKKSDGTPGDHDIFVFYLMPLNYSGPNLIIHIITHKNGEAHGVLNEIKNTIEELRKNLRIPYISTDGDRSYNKWYKLIYDAIVKINAQNDFYTAIETMRVYSMSHWIIVADIVHIGKNLRALIIEKFNLIYISFTANEFISILDIIHCVDIGNALTDIEKSSKMNDKYPVALFSFKVLKVLWEKQKYKEAIWILPMALWYEAIRNEKLDIPSRISMLHLSFELITGFIAEAEEHHIISKLPTVYDSQNRKFKAYFFGRIETMHKIASALIVFAQALCEFNDINFQHLTTLPEEHINALIRMFARLKRDFGCTLRSIGHLEWRECEEINDGFMNSLVPRNRLDSCGGKVDPETMTTSIPLCDDAIADIKTLVFKIKDHAEDVDNNAFQYFTNYIEEIEGISAPIPISHKSVIPTKAYYSQLEKIPHLEEMPAEKEKENLHFSKKI